MIYWLVACTFAFQFKDAFAKDFSPQQFGAAPQGGCEMVVHEVCVMLDLHIDWVVLQMNIYMLLISYLEQPFFKSCSFLPWIC